MMPCGITFWHIFATITGAWCSDIANASHADGTGFKSQCGHLTAEPVLRKHACALRILATRKNLCINLESDPGHIDQNYAFYH